LKEKIKILFVDDEEHNRNAFNANFRRKYQIYLCSSGVEGLKILKEIPGIDMVITDQKMPQMTGIEFLELIGKEMAPVRIVVTAHRDMTVLDAALKEGTIDDYYDKPWHIDELERIIDNAIKTILKKNMGNKLRDKEY
jgi:response regulator RpfG family c-di-GMP phosphodiesterase